MKTLSVGKIKNSCTTGNDFATSYSDLTLLSFWWVNWYFPIKMKHKTVYILRKKREFLCQIPCGNS